jgi:hypothetical protein
MLVADKRVGTDISSVAGPSHLAGNNRPSCHRLPTLESPRKGSSRGRDGDAHTGAPQPLRHARLLRPHHKRPCRRAAEQRDEVAALSRDHLVGAGEQHWRDFEADRSRCLEIDQELELGRALDGKIGGLGALQYPVDVNRGAAAYRHVVRSIRH